MQGTVLKSIILRGRWHNRYELRLRQLARRRYTVELYQLVHSMYHPYAQRVVRFFTCRKDAEETVANIMLRADYIHTTGELPPRAISEEARW